VAAEVALDDLIGEAAGAVAEIHRGVVADFDLIDEVRVAVAVEVTGRDLSRADAQVRRAEPFAERECTAAGGGVDEDARFELARAVRAFVAAIPISRHHHVGEVVFIEVRDGDAAEIHARDSVVGFADQSEGAGLGRADVGAIGPIG
jgi:hypothetical protein